LSPRQDAALARPASTVPHPSFRSCQVEPMTCTSRCALPNSHLRVGCHCPRQPLFSSASPLDEFSCLTWPVQRPTHVHQRICAANFPRRTHNCTNLRCRFFPLVAWLPLPQCLDQQSSSSSLGLSIHEIPGTLPDRPQASAMSCP